MTRDDPAVIRFAGDLIAALGRPLGNTETVLLAVSGGADSMAMLALANAALPGRIAVATVDHRLRSGSTAEAAMVAGWCGKRAIAHATLVADGLSPGTGLQARARTARYQLLVRWAVDHGSAVLLTAHHAGDQAETFLMRAARGSGVAGLRGIPVRRTLGLDGESGDGDAAITLVRPLLGWTRTELHACAGRARMPIADDPSNADERYERVRVRRLLAEQDWLDPVRIAAAAAHVAEADAALSQMADWGWRTRRIVVADQANPDRECRLDLNDLPRELVRRLSRMAMDTVRRANGIVGPAFASETNIEPLLDAVVGGKSATQAGVLVSARDGVWRYRPEPPRRAG